MSDAVEYIYPDGHYTYKEYKDWPEYPRYQLFGGEAVMMSAPSLAHQRICMELSIQIGTFLRGKPCQAYASPVDVRLFFEEDESDDTVVQPDIIVVCDKDKQQKNFVKGAPDLVIEVLSPSNTKKEYLLKFNYYLDSGVREYWVLEPETKIAYRHVFENGHGFTIKYTENDTLESAALSGLAINLADLWALL